MLLVICGGNKSSGESIFEFFAQGFVYINLIRFFAAGTKRCW